MSYAPVPAPPLERPLVHLLAAARTPTGETLGGDSVRWQQGITYQTLEGGEVVLFDICDPTVREVVRPSADGSRRVEAASIYASAVYECSTFGPRQEYADNALAILDANLPRAVEHELWTGALSAAAGHATNRWLARDSGPSAPVDITPGTGAVPPHGALGLLEKALAEVYNGRGIVHLDRAAATYLWPTDKPSERLIVTKVGNYVVPGVGYSGTGPDGTAPDAGESWVYITPMVTVRVGAPEVPDAGAVRRASVDVSVDRVQIRPRVPFTVDWDGPDCSAFAILMQTKVT